MNNSKNLNELIDNKIKKYLCPPGNGVFTVHTAKENKEGLHQKLYQTTDTEAVVNSWEKSLSNLEKDNRPCLLGVTLDTGGGIQRGANWGPLFIRNVIPNEKLFDLGDVKTIPHLLHDKYLNNETISSCQDALYGNPTSDLPVSALSITEDICQEFYKNFPDKKLIALGGDHSVSYALVKPWIEAKRKAGKKVAIIHFDAHTDLMPKRLGIDICFASWAYHMIPLLEKPADLIQFGIRSSGQERSYWESNLGVQQFWADDIINDSESITKKTIQYLKEREIDELYISFDIDALDSDYASATGTPEKGGLAPHTCAEIIAALGENFSVTGADLVEVAPFVKSTHFSGMSPEPETTLQSSAIVINKFLEAMDLCQ